MASNPPSECCMKGVTHEGTPKGEFKQYAGVDTYITHPRSMSTEKVIIFLSDIFGFSINSKLLADDFAANGYLVIMPDILDKDPVLSVGDRPEGFSLSDWLAQKNHQPEFVQVVVDKTLAEIKKDLKPKKIGAVGYCFGGKYAVRLLNGHIDAGYTGHPTSITLDEIAAIRGPLAISASEIDHSFTAELRYQTEAKLAEIGATYQITLFGGISHGFAVRADMKDPKQRFAKEQALFQAVAWFNEYLK